MIGEIEAHGAVRHASVPATSGVSIDGRQAARSRAGRTSAGRPYCAFMARAARQKPSSPSRCAITGNRKWFPLRELSANLPINIKTGGPMNVVGRNRLKAFCGEHADARKWVENWLSDVATSSWKTSHDISQRYASASFLAENGVIFNVKGNDYRMETTVAYKTGVVVVRWIGTHAEYDKRNKRR